MYKSLVTTFCSILLLCIQDSFADSCGTCDPNACEPPQDCLAGVVKDSCDCCFVCGRREGERCDNAELNLENFGKCGDDLECLVRNDLHWDDPPEAVCSCISQNPLCGSDYVTYENKCQLTEARYRRRDGLRAISSEPCVVPPRIVSSPHNVRNSTGSSAVMACEARGWPTPTVQWLLQNDDKRVQLPGNNTRVAVHFSNGPGDGETTSWLLFPRLSEEDEGTYVCKAENDAGSAVAMATVSIHPEN